jgi:RNA polymerase sigma factor (sigma-70 family)
VFGRLTSGSGTLGPSGTAFEAADRPAASGIKSQAILALRGLSIYSESAQTASGEYVSGEVIELKALMDGAAKGDRAAFQALYQKTAAKLFAIVLRIVRDRAAAEDILQDTFLKVWQKAETYTSSAGEPLSWLASIARNRAIDVLRKKNPVLFDKDEEGADWFEKIMDPRDQEANMVAMDGLRHCLERIEVPVRNCILLAYYDGYSREELASRFDRPVNTIKTWLHRGLAALKACLDTQR